MLAFSPSLKLCAMASGHRRVVLPCQRARRQRWQRDKMQADPDCRENQLRSQRAWLERRPEYWRHYHDINPEYVQCSGLADDLGHAWKRSGRPRRN